MNVGGALRSLVSCRVCDGPVDFAFTVHERMIGTRESFDYLECSDCGCLQIEAIPTDLDRFYPADYYTSRPLRESVRASGQGWRRLHRGWTGLRIWLARRPGLRLGRRYGGFGWFAQTETGTVDAILDVGCGSGRLLDRMHRAGFSHLTGIDPRGVPGIRAGGAPRFLPESLESHVGRYRLVMAHHSFEHVREPRRAFAAFAGLVEPGGWLLLRVPRADSEARVRYGAEWVQLDAPRHLHLHTQASIEALARDSGFRLARVEDDSGPFQIWGSELYQRDIALSQAGRGGRGVFGGRDRLAFRWRARRLRRSGRGDQACFYLQRDPDEPTRGGAIESPVPLAPRRPDGPT